MSQNHNFDAEGLGAVSPGNNPGTEVVPARRERADKLRVRVRELRNEVAENYYEMARHLYTIQKEAMYTLWGYDSFSEYVEHEVSFKWRKVMYLLKIYRYFALDLGSQEVFERVKPLGWGKAAALVDVINAQNADKWIEKANNLPQKKLEDEARAARASREKKQQEKDQAQAHREQTEQEEQRLDKETRKGNAVYSTGEESGDEKEPSVDTQTSLGYGTDPLPSNEFNQHRERVGFTLSMEQKENLENAMRIAKDIAEDPDQDGRGYLIDFIATGFTAFHNGAVRETKDKHSAQFRWEILNAIERSLGLEIVAFKKGTLDVVYGEEKVDRTVKEEPEE